MSTTHIDDRIRQHPGDAVHPAARCAAVLCHGRLQLAWDPASGHHRLGIDQAPRPRPTRFST